MSTLLEQFVTGSFGKKNPVPPPPPIPPPPQTNQTVIVRKVIVMSAVQFPVPEALKLFEGNVAENWRQFLMIWTNFELATGYVDKKTEVRVAALLSVIGKDGVSVFQAFDWENVGDEKKIEKVLEQFEKFCIPRSSVMFETFKFYSRKQEGSELIDSYSVALRRLADNCEFKDKERRIRDQLVVGLRNDKVRERLLREANPTLQKVLETVRAYEMAVSQSKVMAEGKSEEAYLVQKDTKVQGSQDRQRYKKKDTKDQQHDKSKRDNLPKTQCKFCGREHERKKEKCPAWDKKCNKCGAMNHFSVCCTNKTTTVETVDIFLTNAEPVKRKTITVEVNNKELTLLIDSGASANILPMKDYVRLTGDRNCSKMTKGNIELKVYGGNTRQGEGTVKLKVNHQGRDYTLKFIITKLLAQPLLGLASGEIMGIIQILSCDQQTLHTIEIEDPIIAKYHDVFEGIGTLQGTYKIQMDPTFKPVVHAARRVPVAIREPMKQMLKELEQQDIIQKVTEPTDWVSSITTQKKPDGRIRICLDPKDLNKAIRREHYQLPTLEDVTTRLSKAKVFSLVDATWGFWQILLDEESSYLTTFNSPFGRYRWKRMPFGISSAPEVWQRRMSELVEDLQGIEVMADDFLVAGFGDTLAEATVDHDRNLEELLKKARVSNLKLNRKKLRLRLTELTFMGHVITGKGIEVDPRKVEAVTQMPKPTDVKGVQRYLGMVQYLAKFLPTISDISEPLRRLTDDGAEWDWIQVHDAAWNKVNQLVTSTPVLAYYDVTKEVTIQCDASEKGIGAVLMQLGRPVAYSSRAMSVTEQRYAQIEKEMLAIVHACTRFHQYIYGREKVTVESDHKPLEDITRKAIGKAPKRLQRMMLAIQDYRTEVNYLPGAKMHIADALSRAFLPTRKKVQLSVVEEIENTISLECEMEKIEDDLPNNPERWAAIKQATEDDEQLQRVRMYILNGWPVKKKDVHPSCQQYHQHADEMTIEDQLVLKGDRVVMPKTLRRGCMEKIHSSHIGIEGCLRRAREYVYWPGMTAELREFMGKCEVCNTFRPQQQKEPLIPHEIPTRAWQNVSMDLFAIKGESYLIISDHYSNWFEYCHLTGQTSGEVIINTKRVFARFGLPERVVTDNGRQFDCKEFDDFAAKWEFRHVKSSPYYPQSNGKAENAVKICKSLMKKSHAGGTDFHLALLDWRNTPSAEIRLSPAQRMFGRRTKTLIPTRERLLEPAHPSDVHSRLQTDKTKQKLQYDRNSKELKPLDLGDTIRMKRHNSEEWSKGIVISKQGPREYRVKVGNKTYQRNRRQLRKSTEDPIQDSVE